jgi:hypothetical protein
VASLTQYLRFMLSADSAGLNASEYLHGINYLVKPSHLTAAQQKASTEPDKKSVSITGMRDSLLEEERHALDDIPQDVKQTQVRIGETYRADDAPVRDDDDSVEIEIVDDVNSDLIKRHDGGNQIHEDRYGYADAETASRSRRRQDGVQVKYRISGKVKDFDVVTSSLTSLYVIIVILTVFIIFLMYRKMHCRVCRQFRLN